MKTAINEIARNVFRLTIKESTKPLGFNHFLIQGERPALIHLGHSQTFQHLRRLVSEVVDPSSIRYLAFSHLEADESGAMHDWLAMSPQAEIIAGKEAISSVKDSVDGRWRKLADMESVCLGDQELMLLETPHVPHNWDACLFYLPCEHVLFGSDLGTQFGDCLPVAASDVLDEIFLLQDKIGYISYGPHLDSAISKIESLSVRLLAVMHGSALSGEQCSRFFERLREVNLAMMAGVRCRP